MTQPHMYLVRVGNVRGDTPQEIRKTAIDLAVNEVPDPGAQYEIVSGYHVASWDDDRSRRRGEKLELSLDPIPTGNRRRYRPQKTSRIGRQERRSIAHACRSRRSRPPSAMALLPHAFLPARRQ